MTFARPPRGRRPSAAMTSTAMACVGAIASCSSGAPSQALDDLTVEVDATPAPPDPSSDGGASDAPFGLVEGSSYGAYNDAAASLAVCDQCACPSGTYCFGGATGHTVFSGVCDQTDSGSGLEIGCEPLPGACANEPDCVCLLEALRPQLACLAVCAESGGFTVYCPTP